MIFLALPALALAAEHRWSWIQVSNVVGRWEVEDGPADVTINGRTFTVKLFWNDSHPLHGTLHKTLHGSIINGRLQLTETIEESDDRGSTWIGTRVVAGAGTVNGTEAITLSDSFSMLGITRNLSK